MIPDWLISQTHFRIAKDGGLYAPLHDGAGYSDKGNVWIAPSILAGRAQEQTAKAFGYKWQREGSYDSPQNLARIREWELARFGDPSFILAGASSPPLVLDAGCGSAVSALEYFGSILSKIHYVGVDISDAIFTARKRLDSKGIEAVLIQDDMTKLPFSPETFDCIFAEGVLHHTDSTKNALGALVALLKSGGHFLFYVYNKKGPIREFTDDFIREAIQTLPPDKAWDFLYPLTDIGMQLGKIDAVIDLPSGLPVPGIPPGTFPLQRFFYWYFCKAFYSPELTREEMNHINFDWYFPKNSHRQTPEEVRAWCEEFGLHIKRMQVEEAGISVVATKQ